MLNDFNVCFGIVAQEGTTFVGIGCLDSTRWRRCHECICTELVVCGIVEVVVAVYFNPVGCAFGGVG